MIDAAKRTKADLDLFLVSNDFHLVRLSKDVRVVQNATKDTQLRLGSLTLIGAERFLPDNVKRALDTPAYSKRFYFEALSDFFRRNQFLDDRGLYSQFKHYQVSVLEGDLKVTCFPCAPFLTAGNARQIQFRMNTAVLFPVNNASFMKWVTDYFRRDETDTPAVRARMRLLRNMGGRHTQPTVRIAGEIKIGQAGQLDVTLARNFDGVSHAVQLGLTSAVNSDLAALTTYYNLLSLNVIASYAYQDDNGDWMLLFHHRSRHKYTFPCCWDCAVEGPIYKDDFVGKETLAVGAAAERLFERVHIESINHGESREFSFETFGITFDPEAQQCCIQGVLKGRRYGPNTFDRASNELVDEDDTCRATPEDVASLMVRHNDAKWNPSALYNIVFTLQSFGFEKQQIKSAFEKSGVKLTNLRGLMTA